MSNTAHVDTSDMLSAEYDLLQPSCRQLKAVAEEKTNGPPDEELQQQFCELSEDLEELQTEMVRLRAEAEGIACVNPRVVRQAAGDSCDARILSSCMLKTNVDVLQKTEDLKPWDLCLLSTLGLPA